MSNLTLQDITKAGRDPTKAVMVTSRAGVLGVVDINLISIFGWAEILSEHRVLIIDDESNPTGRVIGVASVEIEKLTKALHTAALALSLTAEYSHLTKDYCYNVLANPARSFSDSTESESNL
jgi:hypothetical protein